MTRLAITTVCLVLAASTASADIGPGRAMVAFGGSYFGGNLTSNGELVSGTAINLGVDVVHPVKPVSLLVAFSWGQMTRQDDETAGLVERSLSTWPVYIGAKYWFGPRWLKGFIGAAGGVWFVGLDTLVDGVTVHTTADEGFGLMVPVGVSISITRGLNINVGYAPNLLLDTTALENDLLHSVNFSLGFCWGN